MGEPFVIVFRSYDALQTEMLGELLRDGGVAARVLGTRSAALVGVAPNIMQMHIEVPVSQAGAATDFLEAYFAEDGEALLRREGILDAGSEPEEDAPEEGGAEAEEEPPAPAAAPGVRRPLLAAGSVMLLFGFGHVYARRLWTAAVLAGGQLVALYALATAQSWPELSYAGTLFASILLFDLLGSQLACRAANRGVRRPIGSQLALGALFVAAAVGLAGALGPRISAPKPARHGEPTQLWPMEHRLLYE